MRNKEPKLYWRTVDKNGKWTFQKAITGEYHGFIIAHTPEQVKRHVLGDQEEE